MTDDLRAKQQRHLRSEFTRLYSEGVRKFDFMGGRRSGKTYFILQRLLGFLAQGQVISVATMTDTQGRLGAYQDAKDILDQSPTMRPYCQVLTTPREIRCSSGGRMFFNSYQSSERAKGIACDWLYINEGNNFTEQQYIDLAASVRCGVFVDRNPNTACWTERNGFTLIHSTWKDNADNLTGEQKEWFAMLKRKAESPDATSVDVALYRMYYLGEYAEIVGSIFTPANLQRQQIDARCLQHIFVYGDPSAMVGNDYFALVLAGTDGQRMYVLDTWSANDSTRMDVVQRVRDWCKQYDVERFFVECNGYIGQEFYKYAKGEFGEFIKPYMNSDNKAQRILANYEALCSRVIFNDTPEVAEFLAQVYQFDGKQSSKAHDDNIDAVNSAFEINRLKHYL